MIELKLKEFFLDSDAIRDRVGVRIYPGKAPQGVEGEMIILQEVTGSPEYDLEGEVGVDDTLVQVDCYSSTPRHAEGLASLVRNRLSGYLGTIGKTDPQYVQSCRIISKGQETEEPEHSDDQWVHRYRMDFALYVDSTIPTFT